MKNKKIVIPLAVAAVVAVTAISVTTAFASAAGAGGMAFGFGKMGKDHEEIMEAMDSGDYNTWKSKIQEKADNFTNEESFNQLSEVHRLMKEGKVEEAGDLAEEFGLPMPMHRGKRGEMREAKEAVANNDYETWQQIVEEKLIDRMANAEEKINKETFDKLVQAHNLMEDGKMDEARDLMKETGFPGGGHNMKGGGMFGHRFER